MSCADCQQLRSEIYELKTLISHSFDKIFVRFNDNDVQFDILKNIMNRKDASIEHHRTTYGNNDVSTKTSTSPELGSFPIDTIGKIDSNLIQNAVIYGHSYLSCHSSVVDVALSTTGSNQIPDEKIAERQQNNNETIKMERKTIVEIDDSIQEIINNSNRKQENTSVKRANLINSGAHRSGLKRSHSGHWKKLEQNDPEGQCPYCFKQFSRVYNVKRHLAAVHGDVNSKISRDNRCSQIPNNNSNWSKVDTSNFHSHNDQQMISSDFT